MPVKNLDTGTLVTLGVALAGGVAAMPKLWRAFKAQIVKGAHDAENLQAVPTIQEGFRGLQSSLDAIRADQQGTKSELAHLRKKTDEQSGSLEDIRRRLGRMEQQAADHAAHDDRRFEAVEQRQEELRTQTRRAANSGGKPSGGAA